MSNICVCSLAVGTEYKNAVKLCTKTLQEYCELNSYDLIMDESMIVLDRPLMWSKIPLLKYAINLGKYDYVVWIDGDIMIINPDITLESLITLYMGSKSMMLAVDFGGCINTGFWIMKSDIHSINILDVVYDLPEFASNQYEQGTFGVLYQHNILNLQDICRIIPEYENRLCNAGISNYVIGDFLIHFLGIKDLVGLAEEISDNYPYKLPEESLHSYTSRIYNLTQARLYPCNTRYIKSPWKIKIAVCTYNKYLKQYSKNALEKYCSEHGYSFYCDTKILDETFDYMVFVEPEVMIMNNKIKLEILILENMKCKDLLLSKDVDGKINSGIVIMRNSQDIMRLCNILPIGDIYSRDLLKVQSRTSVIDQKIMNTCIGLYNHGDFLIYFYSLSPEGFQEALTIHYPYVRDDETTEQGAHRLLWLKNK